MSDEREIDYSAERADYQQAVESEERAHREYLATQREFMRWTREEWSLEWPSSSKK